MYMGGKLSNNQAELFSENSLCKNNFILVFIWCILHQPFFQFFKIRPKKRHFGYQNIINKYK